MVTTRPPAQDAALSGRIALEALRNGVPNREAVRILGCSQERAESRFSEMLDSIPNADNAQGMLVSGDFGTGKSHLLTYMEHLALSRNFVCSKVVISKETPLYDLAKTFKSAADNGRIPKRNGQMIQELMQVMNPASQSYADFYRWANEAAARNLIHTIFPASLMVHERSKDIELDDKIESFWGGDRIGVADVKAGLRDIGQARTFQFKAPKQADLPPQRLRFVTELIKAAGYRGWVILIDEIELIGYYSILQRGRSYAELARLMGQSNGEDYPGLAVVGAVTDDFASEIISPDGNKKDRDYASAKLENNVRYSHLAPLAETGMNLLERACLPLRSPTEEDVNATIEKLRQLYSDAYDWNAPSLEGDAGGAGYAGRMRYKVRAAINTWDLLRLYPDASPEIVGSEYKISYHEDAALEKPLTEDS